MKTYRRGWFNDSHRHYLAAKGVRTRFMADFKTPSLRFRKSPLQQQIDTTQLRRLRDSHMPEDRTRYEKYLEYEKEERRLLDEVDAANFRAVPGLGDDPDELKAASKEQRDFERQLIDVRGKMQDLLYAGNQAEIQARLRPDVARTIEEEGVATREVDRDEDRRRKQLEDDQMAIAAKMKHVPEEYRGVAQGLRMIGYSEMDIQRYVKDQEDSKATGMAPTQFTKEANERLRTKRFIQGTDQDKMARQGMFRDYLARKEQV